MDRVAPAHLIWSKRATFVALALLIAFFHLLPLEFQPQGWGAPDVLAASAFAWVIRRPEFVPPLLIGLVMLLADLLLQRPPGLWALLVLAGCEYLRRRDGGAGGDKSFAAEWLAVAVVLAVASVLMRLVLTLMVVPQPPLSVDVTRLVFTILTYPVVVWVAQSLLGVRALSQSEADRIGARR